ncbi:uncharacterized protein F4807DRAFT_79311 [Annulohypoxylon truncatum]|uniref:uncharacterized protein n=1 Tax=Annulohypoxylon truncatum TaxID=327061 RepID=UPI0020075B09|nr:uncharacterized protein F4807DRAFT_79311 [Annulohypoxylon truncatum]KAI1209946.1 hypothetical protein F4807DRAFT_79311 [Annulohypoxylon truncatum]
MSLPDVAVPSTPPSSPTTGENIGPNRTTIAIESASILSNRDRVLDVNQVQQREDHSRTNSLPRPPTRRGSDNIIPTDHSCIPVKPPIFGSTSHKQGMNEAMAKLNLSHKDDPPRIAAAEDHDKKKKTGLQTMFRLPFERKLADPIQGPEYQRVNTTLTYYSNDTQPQPQSQAQVHIQVQSYAPVQVQVQCQTQPQSNSNSQPQNPPEKEKQPSPPPPPPPPPHQQHKPKDQPPLPPISELPELLQETDFACRRASSQEQYWSSETHQDLWQRLLVAKLVRAKHARLDATQNTALRYARRLAGAEQLETWYRLRTMRKTRAEKARGNKKASGRNKKKKKKEKKEKKTRQQRKEEKRRVAEELERRRKQEEAVRVVRRLLELREGKRGQDYGLLAAMSYDGEIPR